MSRPGGADASLVALEPLLEVAFHVARLGPEADPPVTPPAALRPLLGFASLPHTALRTIRRVLDTEPEFRARVAAVVGRDQQSRAVVGEAGLLYVQRPDGWAERVAELVGSGAHDETPPVAADAAGDRALARRLEGAERAAARAEEELVRARARVQELTRVASDDRRRREQVERDAAATEASLAAARDERDALQRSLDEANGRIRALEDEADSLARALGDARDELGRVGSVHAAIEGARAAVDAVRSAIDGLGSAAPASSAVRPATVAPTLPRVERVRRAAAGAGPQRRPVPLPPGVMADEPSAATQLLRVPGMLVVVDGYNVAHARWGDARPAQMRDQVLALLNGAAARSKASVHVVFDGRDRHSSPAAPRSSVRITFTPEGVEADDVILDLVAALPAEQKVLVVSSDRRVVDGARALGANTVSSEQLLAAWA